MNIISSETTWLKTLLPVNATLQQAIRNLDESGMQISLVTSDDGVLLGTLTDGDIRRGLLRGLDLNSSIDSIIHRDAIVAPVETGRDTVLKLMRVNDINALPVVDESRRLVNLYLKNELLAPANRPNTMVIMAGGQGKRLRPYT